MAEPIEVLLVSARIAHSMAEHARAKFKDELSLDVVLTTSIIMASSAAVKCCPEVNEDEAAEVYVSISKAMKDWVTKMRQRHAEKN